MLCTQSVHLGVAVSQGWLQAVGMGGGVVAVERRPWVPFSCWWLLTIIAQAPQSPTLDSLGQQGHSNGQGRNSHFLGVHCPQVHIGFMCLPEHSKCTGAVTRDRSNHAFSPAPWDQTQIFRIIRYSCCDSPQRTAPISKHVGISAVKYMNIHVS